LPQLPGRRRRLELGRRRLAVAIAILSRVVIASAFRRLASCEVPKSGGSAPLLVEKKEVDASLGRLRLLLTSLMGHLLIKPNGTAIAIGSGVLYTWAWAPIPRLDPQPSHLMPPPLARALGR
jgi:hypothetical protein